MSEFEAAFPPQHAAWVRAGGSYESADAVPGAETILDVKKRILPALQEALASVPADGTVCVVGHGAASKAALVGLLDWDRAHVRSLRGLDNCAWASLVEAGADGGLRLTGYNRQAPDFASVRSLG